MPIMMLLLLFIMFVAIHESIWQHITRETNTEESEKF